MTVTRVKCECGEWRFFVSDWIGQVTETCYGCGYRSALRGNCPVDQPAKKKYVPDADDPRLPICAELGCHRKASTFTTDMCREHGKVRRRAKARARYDRTKVLLDTKLSTARLAGFLSRNSHREQ